MSFLCMVLLVLLLVPLTCVFSRQSWAGGMGITELEMFGDSISASIRFHQFQVPYARGPRANRDLEFFWSPTYDDLSPWVSSMPLSRPLVPPDSVDDNELVRMGRLICEDPQNPFGFTDFTDIRLAYDMLNARIADRTTHTTYKPDANRPVGFLVRAPYDSLNRNHIDAYVYMPVTSSHSASGNYDPVYGDSLIGDERILLNAQTSSNYHKFPSSFISDNEDSLQGTIPLHSNSIMMPGPVPGKVVGAMPTGWASGDATSGFAHEFTHAINDPGATSAMNELRASCAEAIVGVERVGQVRFDVPYTWSLLQFSGGAGEGSKNYQAWRSFSSYLVYNYRGADESSSGLGDDLVSRWSARDSVGTGLVLNKLGEELTDAACVECRDLSYFDSLDSGHDRLQTLIHNWRVASYVNDTSLAEGQYGFPPRFGFDPFIDVGNFQDMDGDSTDDAHAIPPEVTIDETTRDLVMAGLRNSATCTSCWLPMSLTPFGSEYWVVKADPSLATSTKDLVVTVSAEASLCCQSGYDGRLMVSLVLYSQRGDPNTLWQHPEWITGVIGPRWADVESAYVRRPVEFVVPDFGSSGGPQALVAVITLGDGPRARYGQLASIGSTTPVLPYSLRLALNGGSCSAGQRVAVTTDADSLCRFPAWSSDGQEILYQASAGDGTPARIHRQRLDGSPWTLASPPAPTYGQGTPDWSPRGKWIAFAEDRSAGTTSDVWIQDLEGGPRYRVTTVDGYSDLYPTFSPNGQQLVYVSWRPGTQIRRVDVDVVHGEWNDTLLCEFAIQGSPRWTPDGEWIVFESGQDSLYAVSATDGGTVMPFSGALTPRPFSSLSGFDLHAGGGPLIYPGAFGRDGTCGYSCPVGTQGIAVHDTLVQTTYGLFERSGYATREARWAPDGARIAFSSGPNDGGGGVPSYADIYYGITRCNHPPMFVGLNDTTLVGSAHLEFTPQAVDPDGDPLTYQVVARYLPPGATFVDNVFEWDTGLQDSSYYVVFRAIDPLAAMANRVIKITVIPGCPDAVDDLVAAAGRTTASLSWTTPESGAYPDSFDLRLSTSAITEGNFSYATRVTTPTPGIPGTLHCVDPTTSSELDGLSTCTWYYFALKTRDHGGCWSPISNTVSAKTLCSPGYEVQCEPEWLMAQGDGEDGWSAENSLLIGAVETDLYGLKLAWNDRERTPAVRLTGQGTTLHLDQVSLGVVDRDPEQAAIRCGTGILVGSLAAVEQVTDGDANDLTSELGAAGDAPYRGEPGQSLTVEVGSDSAAALVIDSWGVGDASRIVVEVERAGGEWESLTTIRPRRLRERVAVPLSGSSLVRLRFGGGSTVAALLRLDDYTVTAPTPLTLAEASHSRRGTVSSALATRDGRTTGLASGDRVTLSFSGAAQPTGKVRELWLMVQRADESTALEEASAAKVEPVYSYALYPARPNPARDAVRISYSLARAGQVSLQVFDVAGRLVRRLAQGSLAAGPHEVMWEGRDSEGRRLTAGVYFYRLDAEGWTDQRKLVWLGE